MLTRPTELHWVWLCPDCEVAAVGNHHEPAVCWLCGLSVMREGPGPRWLTMSRHTSGVNAGQLLMVLPRLRRGAPC